MHEDDELVQHFVLPVLVSKVYQGNKKFKQVFLLIYLIAGLVHSQLYETIPSSHDAALQGPSLVFD